MMDALCNDIYDTSQLEVVIFDRYAKTRKIEKFAGLPNDMKYKPRLVTCDKVEKTIQVPVAEIQLSTVDKTGQLVEKGKATSVLIEYLDKDGSVLEVVRMVKD